VCWSVLEFAECPCICGCSIHSIHGVFDVVDDGLVDLLEVGGVAAQQAVQRPAPLSQRPHARVLLSSTLRR